MKVRVALIGNPNVGKSVIFNNLTGMKQHTGNWPGKTVEQKAGTHRHEDSRSLICLASTVSAQSRRMKRSHVPI